MESKKYFKTRSTLLPLSFMVLFSSNGNCQAISTHKRPNIVFILADDHNIQSISSYGSNLIKTPGIDRLAKEGMRFTNCFTINSLCAPSRAALITGKYSCVNGVLKIGDQLDEKQETFPMILQQSGFQTALIGKWHLETEPQGFNYFSVLPGQGQYFDCPMKQKGYPWLNGNKGGIPTKGYITDVITDQAIDWLKQTNSEKPFMLMINHKAPHTPHSYPEKYSGLYASHDLPVPKTFDDDFGGKNAGLKDGNAGFSRLDHIYPDHFTEKIPSGMNIVDYKMWAFQAFFKGYLRLVASLDDNIGRLLKYLDESGLSENTIVIYTSDNGFFLGEHGLFNKMWMYDESIRLPLIVRYPHVVKAGSVNKDLVSILDFAPTLLEFADIKIASTLQGSSIKPLLVDKKPKNWRTAIYYHYFNQFEVPEHEGIRTNKYKLIRFLAHTGSSSFGEMYDLSDDPGERKNLFYNPEFRAIKNRLEKNLNELKTGYEANSGKKLR